MKPCAMRFDGFTWHHNPKSLTVKCKDRVVKYGVPHFREIVESFYDEMITVSGVGELYGEDCVEQYEKLFEVYKNGKEGVLCLPLLMPFYACFEKLEIEASTTPSLLTYSFTFTQVRPRESVKVTEPFITLSKDCTLFEVANEYDVDYKKLVEKNTDIMFINELKKGMVIRLC